MKLINEARRMQQLAGIINESQLNENNASSELDSFLRDLANERLLGGYLLDYNFDSPGMLILHISKEPSKSGQYAKDVEKLGTATYYTNDGKWKFDGPLKIEAGGDQKSTLDRIAKLAGTIKENESNNGLVGKTVETIMISPLDKKSSTSSAKIVKVEDNSIRLRGEFGAERNVRIGAEGINQLASSGEWNAPNRNSDNIVKIKVKTKK